MVAEFFGNVWDYIVSFVKQFNFLTDTLDILIVAFVVYSLIKLVRDSRAEQLIKGIVILAMLLFLSSPSVLNMRTLFFLLKTVFDNGLLVLVVIFQPEIRRALEQAGHSRLGLRSIFGVNGEQNEESIKQWQKAISAACAACETLQRQKMGALIVFERDTKLGEIAKSGTLVNADPTRELIGNVFFNKAPLHDGAMIIRDGRVYAAGCILPLSDNLQISRDLGTRHRAAIGVTENTDATSLVVSEETGTISTAVAGELKRNFSPEALRVALENGIIWDRSRQDKDGEPKGGLFRRGKSRDK